MVEKEAELGDVYFLKIGKIRYLKSKAYKKDCCQICGKKRKTTAHHLIPKRLHCICPFLAEIRVRVCEECDLNFHPENKFIRESDVIKRQSQKILNLKDAIIWRSSKIDKLEKGLIKLNRETEELLDLIDDEFYTINKGGKKNDK